MRAGQFPVLTVAAVSLFSIMAKDKGNFLCFEILNKQPVLMNDSAIKFEIERNATAMYFCAKIEKPNLSASAALILPNHSVAA